MAISTKIRQLVRYKPTDLSFVGSWLQWTTANFEHLNHPSSPLRSQAVVEPRHDACSEVSVGGLQSVNQIFSSKTCWVYVGPTWGYDMIG